jgi:hypothetical protein
MQIAAKLNRRSMKKTLFSIFVLGLGLIAGCDSYETPGSDLQFYIESFSHPIRPGISTTQKGVLIKDDGPGAELSSSLVAPNGDISGVKCNGKYIELETGVVSSGRVTTKKYGKFKIVLNDDGFPMMTLTKEQKKNLMRDCPPHHE